jgi:hypothetical protein
VVVGRAAESMSMVYLWFQMEDFGRQITESSTYKLSPLFILRNELNRSIRVNTIQNGSGTLAIIGRCGV